jgi:hypothetical protein
LYRCCSDPDQPANIRQETAMGPISAEDFSPVGDGASHPLSERYATLAAAQAHYPFVTRLTQEIDWAAIQAALWSAGTPADPRGTTVLVPRGDYRCSDDLRISRQVRLAGMGRGATRLSFGPGAGIVVDGPFTSPDGGHGSYATIADLDIAGERVPGIEQWMPGHDYVAAGDPAQGGGPPDRVCDRNDNRFYYECIQGGTSRNTAPPWTAGAPYNAGDIVQVVAPVYFQCTLASGNQKSGTDEPVWALPADEKTWDGEGAQTHEAVNYLLWQRVPDPDHPPMPPVNRGPWQPSTVYAQGDIAEATADFTNRLFFRSQKGPANAGGEEPAWEADAPGELTQENTGLSWDRGVLTSKMPLIGLPAWKPRTRYERGAVVRSGPPGMLQVVFECTGAGTSGAGPGEPAWNAAIGGVTTDGTSGPGDPPPVTWTCRADPSVFSDGTVVWACKASPGIWLRTQAYVGNVGVQGFTNAGIHIQSQDLPHTNINHWQVYNAAVHQCGLGVVVMGTDCQGGTAIGCEIMGNGYDLSGRILPRGNGGTGVYDRGNGPNNWIGCATEANTGRAFVAATSNAASTVLGCYIEAGQQPSYLGIAAFKIDSAGDDAPNSAGWIIDSSQAVGPFAVPNTRDNGLVLYLGYKSDNPTILYGWQKAGNEFWVFRWDEAQQVWRTGHPQDGLPPASYLTGGTHPRGAFLQGTPSLLLGDPSLLAPPQGPIKVGAFPGKPPWTGEPGDIVCNSAQDEPMDPATDRYAGWICVGPAREWKRFGKIEP